MCGDEDDGGRKCRDQGVGRKRIQENSLLVVNQAHTYSSRRRKTNTKREDGFSQIGVLASDAMVHTQIGICRGCSSCLSALDKGATTRITSATANDRLDTPLPSINGNNVPPGERRFQPRPQLLLPPSFLCETESWLTNVPKILDTHTHTYIYIYIYIHSLMQTKQVAQILSRSTGTKAKRRALVRIAGIALFIFAILLQLATIYTQVLSGYGILVLAVSFLPAHIQFFIDGRQKKNETLTSHVPNKTAHSGGATNGFMSEDTSRFMWLLLHTTFTVLAYYVSPGITFVPVNPRTAFDFVGDLYG